MVAGTTSRFEAGLSIRRWCVKTTNKQTKNSAPSCTGSDAGGVILDVMGFSGGWVGVVSVLHGPDGSP